jgi:hypothetical protein
MRISWHASPRDLSAHRLPVTASINPELSGFFYSGWCCSATGYTGFTFVEVRTHMKDLETPTQSEEASTDERILRRVGALAAAPVCAAWLCVAFVLMVEYSTPILTLLALLGALASGLAGKTILTSKSKPRLVLSAIVVVVLFVVTAGAIWGLGNLSYPLIS